MITAPVLSSTDSSNAHNAASDVLMASADDAVASTTSDSASPDAATQEMEAALALSLFRLPATPSAPLASQIDSIPDAADSWPFTDGKGCFAKGRDGKDLPFLERLYYLLSLPNLSLPGQPGRTLGEAIRWKSAASLAAAGLPEDLAAFEIGDVNLLEAAIYPQYASGDTLPGKQHRISHQLFFLAL